MKKTLIIFLSSLFGCNHYEPITPREPGQIVEVQAAKPIIAIYGTSIEHGTTPSPDSSWVNRFKKAIAPTHTVVNYGVYNRTYMDSTYYTIWGILRNTKNSPMDIIVLGGPTNDAQNQYFPNSIFKFKKDYQRAIDSLKKWHPNAKIILNTAIKSKSPIIPQHRLDTMVNARVRTIAKNNKLRVCNMSSLPNSILSPDLIHPNDAGYGRMATFFYNWFIKTYPIDPIVISPE